MAAKRKIDRQASVSVIGSVSVIECLQHFIRMLSNFDLIKDFFDLSFFVDQKSHAINSHVGPAHELFLAIGSISV